MFKISYVTLSALLTVLYCVWKGDEVKALSRLDLAVQSSPPWSIRVFKRISLFHLGGGVLVSKNTVHSNS